ncbi:hypothetical protein Pcinc_010087 [Petrolisthes cinctipes]|uniref:HMG box domain-containing protein n=1 Tax=Petrolisthes cinctipes TaxID=88211 RepID=A0AAE1KUU0_PETCI|nr:hypothetical protein Pcinc_010087 [Petrolisthes cinctipes]
MGLHSLPQDTIRLIKSTQVITTPGSIIKELVENALDAGAKSITIKMENHGFSLLEVRDNGVGIKNEDIKFIAKPHYTSKISSFSDLASLTTYGFRGEALASLCAVSDCCVITKTPLDSMAYTYTFDHQGNVAKVKPAAAPNGTTVCVSNLFKNIPVRRQYYTNAKRRKEELKKVEDIVMAFSLAAPATHLTLSHDKNCIIQKSPAQDLRGAVMNSFPTVFKDMVKKERHIDDLPGRIVLYLPSPGCCGNPNLTRTTSDRLFILINQRPVTHKSIEKMVKGLFSQGSEGCHSRYPVGVVALTVPPDALDVNLEPNKTKMYLKDEDVILETLKEILCSLYSSSNPVKKMSGGEEALAESVDTDITCTLACITQPQKETLSSFASERPLKQKVTKEWEKNDNLHCLASEKILTRVDDLPAFKKIIGRNENYRSSNDKLASIQDVSGIEPLPPSHPSLKNNVEKHRELNAPERSVQTLISGLRTQNSSISRSDQDENKLHESVIGSDGIPVFKIAPLPTSNTMFVQDLEEHRENMIAEQSMEDGEENINTGEKTSEWSKEVISGGPHSDKKSVFQNKLQTTPCGKALDSYNCKPEEDNTVGGGSWSRGLPMNGKNIQTVQIVNAITAGTKTRLCQSESDPKKRSTSETPDESVSKPSKRTKVNSLGPASFDYIYGKPIKKPSSPFILFSRNIRTQVLSEHPGADFAFIAQQMAARWKSLGREEKLHYNNLAKAESEKYQEQVKKLQEGRGLNSSQKVSLHKVHMTKGTLDRYVAPVTPRLDRNSGKTKGKPSIVLERPWLEHSKEVSITLNSIRKRLKRKQLQPSCDTAFHLLGSLTVTEGGWICLQDEKIYALNIYRVYEKVLVHTLLDTFSLPLKTLSDAIPFNASSLGLDNWKTLLQLSREPYRDRNFQTVTDPRLIKNGFKVALYLGSNDDITHGEVTHMTPAIGFIGIIDLKEILDLIASASNDSVYLSRPLKIQHWIKGEAVRMIRSGPNIVQRDDVLEKLRKWRDIRQNLEGQDNLLWEKETCIHNKPMLTQLYCLDSLPQSQSQH